MNKIIFRCDSSYQIGTGHVHRSMNLAYAIKEISPSVEIKFHSKELPGHTNHLLKDFVLTQDDTEICDLLVIDHYDLDETYEKKVSQYTKKIAVIDDLFNRKHYCDFLIDHNFYKNHLSLYDGKLIKPNTTTILGPSYCLIKSKFNELRKNAIPRSEFKNILIFFGGTDSTGESLKLISAIKNSNVDYNFDLVIGKNTPTLNQIKENIKNQKINLHIDTPDMPELMLKNDLFIGASGVATWERSSLGLTGKIVTTADNQIHIAKNMHDINAHDYLGDAKNITIKDWEHILKNLNAEKEKLKDMSKKSFEIVDGLGASRVAKILLGKNS